MKKPLCFHLIFERRHIFFCLMKILCKQFDKVYEFLWHKYPWIICRFIHNVSMAIFSYTQSYTHYPQPFQKKKHVFCGKLVFCPFVLSPVKSLWNKHFFHFVFFYTQKDSIFCQLIWKNRQKNTLFLYQNQMSFLWNIKNFFWEKRVLQKNSEYI